MPPTPPGQPDLSGHDGNIDGVDQIAEEMKVNASIEELGVDDIVKASLTQSRCERVKTLANFNVCTGGERKDVDLL